MSQRRPFRVPDNLGSAAGGFTQAPGARCHRENPRPILGQHANQDAWWSVASSGILWGGYVNGVAAWGRDHPLGCKASYYASENQRCGYMDCVEHGRRRAEVVGVLLAVVVRDLEGAAGMTLQKTGAADNASYNAPDGLPEDSLQFFSR